MIAGPVVVDASVVVEYLVELRFTRESRTLVRALALEDEAGMWVPDLLYVETASALRRLSREKAISRPAARRAVDQLTRLPFQRAATRSLVQQALKLSNSVTVYDAVYVALAQTLDAPLITTDQRLTQSPLAKRSRIVPLTEAVKRRDWHTGAG